MRKEERKERRKEGKKERRKEEGKNLKSIGVRDGMGGQGQYRVGRGSIGCSTTQIRFSADQKAFMDAFLVG